MWEKYQNLKIKIRRINKFKVFEKKKKKKKFKKKRFIFTSLLWEVHITMF